MHLVLGVVPDPCERQAKRPTEKMEKKKKRKIPKERKKKEVSTAWWRGTITVTVTTSTYDR